jgi:hypothetical protein
MNMKNMKKLTALLMAVLLIGAMSATAFAADTEFGSAAVTEDKTYTLSEMLTYAIEDEYLAHAEYEKIIDSFGAQTPFTNILKAEETHIARLEPLFTEYGVTKPEDNADSYTVVPSSLLEAMKTGVTAEINNIAMYEKFLSQDLPDDVRLVFTALKNASENHLAAFERGVDRLSDGVSQSYSAGRQTKGFGRSR